MPTGIAQPRACRYASAPWAESVGLSDPGCWSGKQSQGCAGQSSYQQPSWPP